MIKMKVCWKCGNTATDDEDICAECGEPLDDIESDEENDFNLAFEDDNENGNGEI